MRRVEIGLKREFGKEGTPGAGFAVAPMHHNVPAIQTEVEIPEF